MTEDQKEAIKFIDTFEAQLEITKLNEKRDFTLQGFDSNNLWYVASWSENEINKPDKCLFESCICACKSRSLGVREPTSDCQKGPGCFNPKVKQIIIEHHYFEDVFEELQPGPKDPYETQQFINRGKTEKISNQINLQKFPIRFEIEKQNDFIKIISTE